MKREITLRDIAGNTTERTVWKLMLELSCHSGIEARNAISPDDILIHGGEIIIGSLNKTEGDIKTFCAPELFHEKAVVVNDASVVWTIGALAFYTILGVEVFEGKGGESQTSKTEIPRISSAHASQTLGSLIYRCLNYSPADRPSLDEICESAKTYLANPSCPGKKVVGQSGKRYLKSLVKFWPEEMVPILLVLALLLLPGRLYGQTETIDIPDEMASLVERCVDLRSSQNISKVSKAMERDMKWTMMDELSIDRNGECTVNDAVDSFGLNDIGFEVLKRHSGITNSGGRFRDGRDPRYKYSFIEITVKKGCNVKYLISGREGFQLFAIVPFEKDADFVASIPDGNVFWEEGVCYIQLRQNLTSTDSFQLMITNNSGRNSAFAIVNYNSRDSE